MGEPVGLRVKGLRELGSALQRVDRDLRKELNRYLKDAAREVSEEANRLFDPIDPRSAAGFKPRIRGFGSVTVAQTKRRTTGFHPQYGSLQMRRALIPALTAKQEAVMSKLEEMLDKLGKENGF